MKRSDKLKGTSDKMNETKKKAKWNAPFLVVIKSLRKLALRAS